MSLERMKLAAEGFVPWLQLLAVVLGGGFALLQYRDAASASRVAKALEVYQRYSKDEVLAARTKIDRAWLLAEPQMIEFLRKRSGTPRVQLASQWRTFVSGVVKNARVEPELLTVVDYFEEVATCIDAAICDPETARRFLKARALLFYRQHYCYIVGRRQQTSDPDFAAGIEKIIGQKSNDSCGEEAVAAPSREAERGGRVRDR